MAIQNQVTAEVIIAPEASFGVSPAGGAAGAKKLRRVSTSMALGKDVYQSAEVRTDQQIADMRHGTKRPGGGIEAELCNVAFDPLIEALLRGTWAAGSTAAAATYTTIAGAVTSGSAGEPGSVGTLTWTAGDPVTAGFRVGDVTRLTGFTGNTDKNFRIISFGGTSNRTITVTPAPTTFSATAGTNMSVAGSKLLVGTEQRSFSIEQSFPDVDTSELFKGMRIGGGAFRLPPNGMATCSFSFMGQDMVVLDGASAPYFTSPSDIGTDGIFAGPQGSLRFAGAERGIVTGVDLNVDLGLSADPVVGRTTVPNIFYGPTQVTGTVSAYLEDKSLIAAFVDESEVDLCVVLEASGAGPRPFIAFNMQRIKLGGATKSVGAQGGVVATFPFTALKRGVGTGVDNSTLVIQRSNAS